jgi:hypothetical protein
MPMRLNIHDVAELLRVSPQRVRQYVEEGRLVARCEGSRRLYVLPHEVQQFCEAMPVYGQGAAIQELTAPRSLRRRGGKNSDLGEGTHWNGYCSPTPMLLRCSASSLADDSHAEDQSQDRYD